MRLPVAAAMCCVAIFATSGGAQTIRGRVFLPDSVSPAAGIVVTATGPGAVTVARTLSTTTGNYVLHVAAPGTYEVRALRIGFRPAITRVTVGANSTTVQNIVLSSLPVAIAGMDVRTSGDCSLKGRDGQTFLQLWEQARGALAATQLWEESGALDVHLVRIEGHVDGPQSFKDSTYEVVDTLHARESIVDRAFAATAPETLAVRGYVRTKADGRTVYDMPNAETLLSDDFVGTHCFSIRSSDEHKDWVGLGFTPRHKTDSIADIRGVLWLERATAELRRLEFEYINLPPAEFLICDAHPFVPLTPELIAETRPPFTQPDSSCYTERNRSNRLALGGHADFVRLPSGEWLVSRWLLRTPPDEGRIRPTPRRCHNVNGKCERCFSGPDCHTLLTMRPRLVTVMGTIGRVTRDGVELYRDDSKAALISAAIAKRAGNHPAAIEGTITDFDGRPLVNAVVQTEDPGRAALTDSAGAFQLRLLPPGTVTVSVRCRGYQPVTFRLPLLRDSTRRASLSLVRDTTRSPMTDCAIVH
jgi:hypothetical protein